MNEPNGYHTQEEFIANELSDTRKTGYDDEQLKSIAGSAIAPVDGILGLKSNIGDLFKRDEDITRGISVRVTGKDLVAISAKVILETGCNDGQALRRITDNITRSFNNHGLQIDKLNISISDVMDQEEFLERYGAGRELN